MDYENKYKDALSVAKEIHSYSSDIAEIKRMEQIFPELAELEDERIRKEIISALKYANHEGVYNKHLAWLEKQDEQKKVSIWKHWKNGIAGGAEGEQIFLIKIGNVYSISSCLGCECDYIELSELDKLMREEKQEKTKWSKEDEVFIKDTIECIDFVYKNYSTHKEFYKNLSNNTIDILEWLKSLKQRNL